MLKFAFGSGNLAIDWMKVLIMIMYVLETIPMLST